MHVTFWNVFGYKQRPKVVVSRCMSDIKKSGNQGICSTVLPETQVFPAFSLFYMQDVGFCHNACHLMVTRWLLEL